VNLFCFGVIAMKRLFRRSPLFAVLLATACVTINIYFPAEQVRGAAHRIVDEVWGDRPQEGAPPPPQAPPGSSFLRLIGPSVAYAAQDIDITTPEIRAIREAMRERSAALIPFLASGHVGVGADGYLKVRTIDGLDLRARGEVTRLVKAENDDRARLYREIARANDFPDRVGEVQSIFAETWRQRAASGWYLEKDGGWVQK
jgi:uncharacterized protein